jgi:hypothetical protein
MHANHRKFKWLASLLALSALSCRSIGPSTVPRDRIDYVTSIGNSWKQQTLLNIVKLRYGDLPIFLEVTQVIAAYQLQSTVAAGLIAGNPPSTNGLIGPFTVTGSAGATDTYTDRPTVIYSPLMGVDFLKKLMTPIPPSAVLFLLQSGYTAQLVLPIAVDSINGVANESRRGMKRPADPQFTRVAELMREVQLAGALQARIVPPNKDHPETSVIIFGLSKDPQIAAKSLEIRSILGLKPDLRELKVYYGGYSGRDDELDLMTRSMLQIMLELSTIVQVPESDVAEGRAAPGLVDNRAGGAPSGPTVTILSGPAAPRDAYVAVQYGGRWFWIPGTDIQSKYTFGFVMLLFSISDTGVKGTAPVVTVPAN